MASSRLLASFAIRSHGAMLDVDRLPGKFITTHRVNAKPRRNIQGVLIAGDVARKHDALSTITLMGFL